MLTTWERDNHRISEHRAPPNRIELLHKYPHLVLKLCDGEIIDAESGESIANLSQFLAANNLSEPVVTEHDPRNQLSPKF